MNVKSLLPSCLLLASLAMAAGAPPPVNLKAFATLPILDEGRVKPLETFAEARLLQFSGKRTFAGRPAIEWFARVIFAPDKAREDVIFRVDRGEVLDALGLPRSENLRYSFKHLEPALMALQDFARTASAVADAERTPFQKSVMRLYQNASLFYESQGVLAFARTAPGFEIKDPATRARLGLTGQAVTWLDLRRNVQALLTELERPRPDESALRAAETMQAMSQLHRDFSLPVLPPPKDGSSPWQSPWEVLTKTADPKAAGLCEPFQSMQAAYGGSDTAAFDRAVAGFSKSLSERGDLEKTLSHARLEVFANHLGAFDQARVLYIMAFLVTLLALMFKEKIARWSTRGAWALLFFALAFHLAGLVLRMMLTGRPPVTNLYESMLFVGFVMAASSLLLERLKTGGMGLLASSLCGAGLLFLAGRFATDGDTLRVLVAVLDSNFWLSTHVLAISIGYSGVILSGVMAHLYFIRALFSRDPKPASLAPLVYGTQAFGLIFTFTGTMLGGVWADQSWGRFWGWDPKENGALMIVIWGSILFHARLAGWIKDSGFAAGSMLGLIVVSFAWFGVNFLGVGLHSYGFSDGARISLYAYWALQAALTAAALYGAWLKDGKAAAPQGTP